MDTLLHRWSLRLQHLQGRRSFAYPGILEGLSAPEPKKSLNERLRGLSTMAAVSFRSRWAGYSCVCFGADRSELQSNTLLGR
jgi:hypothetical protein